MKKSVSVVIPARDSQDTIRYTVDSLYKQTFPPEEVLVVIGRGDRTDSVIRDYLEEGFVRIIRVSPPEDYVRDAMWKRRIGAEEAKGDIIVFIDSRNIAKKDSIEVALKAMEKYGTSVVAGITPAWPNQKGNFWADLHDNALISNVPYFPEEGWVTKENFACFESLPLTGALVFTREVFNSVKSDFAVEFSKTGSSYEDYVLSWLIVCKGFSIFTTSSFVFYHKHRLSWKEYFLQIARSGQGAATMARMYPECPFGKKRLKQVIFISLFMFFLVCAGVLLVFSLGKIALLYSAGVLFIGCKFLGILNVFKAKSAQAFFFPLVTSLLVLNFGLHFVKSYFKKDLSSEKMEKYLQLR